IYPKIPPNLPLPPPLLDFVYSSTLLPLVPASPPIYGVGLPRVCQSPSVSGLEDPSSPPPASESWTL
ncbi:hypothetical protein M9458_042096, partial [Cirrhinus mrigala]